MAYCGIYNSFNTVPTWSWSVQCVSHENGHLLRSPHTHSCAWNGNNTAIDGCYPPEGACTRPAIPAKGTIMSYCNLQGGIDFNLGFGPQPAALMRATIDASFCLIACGIIQPPPTCIDSIQTKTVPCPPGYIGSMVAVRQYNCSTKVWSAWQSNASLCTPVSTCIDSIQTRLSACPINQTGSITETRNKPCSTNTWSPWQQTSNTCVPVSSPCSTIVCSITQRSTDVLATVSGFKNYTHSWTKNGIPQYRDTVINNTPKRVYFSGWSSNKVTNTHYLLGDKLSVIVGSSTAQTPTCWVAGKCEITIR